MCRDVEFCFFIDEPLRLLAESDVSVANPCDRFFDEIMNKINNVT